jgi:hypothetical protein
VAEETYQLRALYGGNMIEQVYNLKTVHFYICHECDSTFWSVIGDRDVALKAWRAAHANCGGPLEFDDELIYGTTGQFTEATQRGEVRGCGFDRSRKTTAGRYSWHKA